MQAFDAACKHVTAAFSGVTDAKQQPSPTHMHRRIRARAACKLYRRSVCMGKRPFSKVSFPLAKETKRSQRAPQAAEGRKCTTHSRRTKKRLRCVTAGALLCPLPASQREKGKRARRMHRTQGRSKGSACCDGNRELQQPNGKGTVMLRLHIGCVCLDFLLSAGRLR